MRNNDTLTRKLLPVIGAGRWKRARARPRDATKIYGPSIRSGPSDLISHMGARIESGGRGAEFRDWPRSCLRFMLLEICKKLVGGARAGAKMEKHGKLAKLAANANGALFSVKSRKLENSPSTSLCNGRS